MKLSQLFIHYFRLKLENSTWKDTVFPANSKEVGALLKNENRPFIPFRNNQIGYGICQYTECSTSSGETCTFPFIYKGRLYDTCITHDDLGSDAGKPWCSIATDEFSNHVTGRCSFKVK